LFGTFCLDSSTLVSSEGFIANLGEARQGLERTIYKSYTADILARGLALVDSSDELGSITLALFPQVRSAQSKHKYPSPIHRKLNFT